MTSILNRLSRGADDAPPARGARRGAPDREVPGMGRLTTRELQVLFLLLDGHRPPGIARTLFLSQSTVRNHLASVFKKLDVASQEALLALFRAVPSADQGRTHTPLGS